jgi:hypothetical protein
MSRKTVRIELPVGYTKSMLALFQSIIKQHKKLGASSPITDGIVKITAFEQRTTQAVNLQTEIEELQSVLTQKISERDTLLGTADGQNSNTAGTLYFETLQIRDFLLAVSRGNEQALEAWGFNVVVGTAKMRNRIKASQVQEEK